MSGDCCVALVWLFLTVPWVCLLLVIVVFPDHTLLLVLGYFLVLQPHDEDERSKCSTLIVLQMYCNC